MARLDTLLKRAGVPPLELTDMTCDSRQIHPNDLFVAYKGLTFDGHDFVKDAVERGAKCVLSERQVTTPSDVVSICDKSLVDRRNELAASFYGNPSKKLQCIGVTGTNGKTSVTYGLSSLIKPMACAGSLGWGKPHSIQKSDMTTEDGVTLQRKLASLVDQGFTSVAMEVSSHGLDQNRVAEVAMDVGVYTNLTRDHLDYHGSMAAYAAAKRKLFENFDLEYAVINIDDWFGRELNLVCRMRGIPTTTYGFSESANVRCELNSLSKRGACGDWISPWGTMPLELPVRSEFGVANCAAIASVLANEIGDFRTVAQCISHVAQPPGRMEFMQCSGAVTVVLDYAHSPGALRSVLSALRGLKPARLLCVFGCGGNRDQGKRPLMGSVVDEFSDFSVLTNDNPRHEDPQRIADDVLKGISKTSSVAVVLDRKEAIKTALDAARENDIVLVAGKGDEQYQEIQGQKIPYSDREVILQLGQAI